MNKLITFLLTFILAYVSSLLLDWSFIQGNRIRESLTVVLIICIILAGFSIIRGQNLPKNPKQE